MMSLLQHIRDHIPEPKHTRVLQHLQRWVGIDDIASLTPSMEHSLELKHAIEGAVNLMRNRAFEWVEHSETADDIATRWKQMFLTLNCDTAFGMRFSTTRKMMATFGFLQRTPFDRGVCLQWRRFHFLPNGKFRPQHSDITMDFLGALLWGLSGLPSTTKGCCGLRALQLNTHSEVQRALDGYVRCTEGVDDWEGSDEEENERIGYSSYSVV